MKNKYLLATTLFILSNNLYSDDGVMLAFHASAEVPWLYQKQSTTDFRAPSLADQDDYSHAYTFDNHSYGVIDCKTNNLEGKTFRSELVIKGMLLKDYSYKTEAIATIFKDMLEWKKNQQTHVEAGKCGLHSAPEKWQGTYKEFGKALEKEGAQHEHSKEINGIKFKIQVVRVS